MESNLPLDYDINNLEVTSESKSYLLEAAKWGRFLAIVGFVFFGLSSLSVLLNLGMLASIGGGFAFLGFIFGLALLALFFFPIFYLYKFSTNTISAMKTSSTMDLTDGLRNLKSLFKFYGIFMAIIIGFYALIFVGMMIFGLGASF